MKTNPLSAALSAALLIFTPAVAVHAQAPPHSPGASASHATDPKSAASYGIGLLLGKPLHGANLTKQQVSLPEIAKGIREALAGKQLDEAGERSIHSFLESIQSGQGGVTPAAKAQASHAIGLSMGERLHAQSLDEHTLSVAQLTRGIDDAMTGKEPSRDEQLAVMTYLQTFQSKLAQQNNAKARAFLAANRKKPGVVETASGLQYKILAKGSGTPPKSTDTVTVHYTGRLLDGTEFDGTDLRNNEPASFPVNGVIPGWQEALALMQPGAKWEIYIPPNLAYGDNSDPPIPPGSLLVFNVELLKVEGSQPGAQPGAH